MRWVSELLNNFHSAILSGNPDGVVEAIRPNPRLRPEAQMAIYIEGYRLRLIAAIASDYPALAAYIGPQEFEKIARKCVEKNLSHHFNLDKYPSIFTDFFIFNTQDNFAQSIARFEGMIAEVFMAEESTPLTAQDLRDLTDETFGQMILHPRTASRLFAFCYPVEAWLSEQRASKNPPRPEPEPTYLYIYRHENEVRREALSGEAYALLRLLCDGKPVGEAIEKAQTTPESLQIWFGEWINKGFFRV